MSFYIKINVLSLRVLYISKSVKFSFYFSKLYIHIYKTEQTEGIKYSYYYPWTAVIKIMSINFMQTLGCFLVFININTKINYSLVR
jgi:hypothetical protein